MKFLVAALFPEARPLIRRLELKKESLGSGLELYIGSDHALLVTGIGRLTAAVKVARAFIATSAFCRMKQCYQHRNLWLF